MAGVTMKIVSAYLRVAKKPGMSTADRARRAMNEPKGASSPPGSVRDTHTVTGTRVGEFVTYTVQPRGAEPTHAVLYLHGGAYIGEIAPQHWDLISDMVAAGLRVEVPIYGLAPQYSYRDAYVFLSRVYETLRGDADSVVVMGDSAGAGLALGLVQSVIEDGGRSPDRMVLVSPWLDLTLGNPAIPAMESRDPWLTRAGLIEAGRAWADGDDPHRLL